MNRYLKFGITILAASSVGFAAGFLVGVKQGVVQFFLLDSSAKGALLTYELRALRAGKTQKIIDSKEIALDGEVVRISQFFREGHPWMFWPQNYHRDDDRYMRLVAAYRKEYPPFAPTLKFGESDPNKVEMEEYVKEVIRSTNEILQKYEK